MTYDEYIKYPTGQVIQIDGVEVVRKSKFEIVPWCSNRHQYVQTIQQNMGGTFDKACAKCGKLREGVTLYKDMATGIIYIYKGWGTCANGQYSTDIYETTDYFYGHKK